MFYISEKWVWIPLYILIIGVLIKLFKRNAIWVILTIIAVVGLNDFISVNLFKNVIMRLRPCHNPTLEGLVHIVNNHCGGQFGFYSSHASNHFGIATIVFGMTKSIVVAWLAIAVTGGADGVSTIVRNTIRQLQTPDHVRGRMTSVNQIFFMGGPQLGEIEAGAVAQFFGAPFAVVTGGIGCIVGTILILWKWPQLRTYNGDEPMLAGATAD